MASDRLEVYRAKRDFAKTGEPAGKSSNVKARPGGRYLIQQHAARVLHFDFRLEHDGVLKSWAVPRGPSLDPKEKRLAVRTEDHPLDYGDFEGVIPKGQYGGGTVMLWDTGTWRPLIDPDQGLSDGSLKFEVEGKRIRGRFALVRMKPRKGEKRENWLLIKERESDRTPGSEPVKRFKTSVVTGRSFDEIAKGAKPKRKPKPSSPKRNAAKAGKTRETNHKPPAFVAPQLATLVEAPPEGKDWLHEIKLDGYRAHVAIGSGRVRIFTRNGHDWSDRFAPLVPSLAALSCGSASIDGEIAVADAKGHTSFAALQEALAEERGGYGFYAFDLLHLDGKNLRTRPLIERKRLLRDLLNDTKPPLFYSDHVEGSGEAMFESACRLHLEGIISKRADGVYRSGRTKSWLKAKCGHEQEFVIVGWRPSRVKGRPLSSLLLAVRENGELRYAGRVGSGFDERNMEALADAFGKLARKDSAVAGIPGEIRRDAKFVEPKLVAEIAFRGWTGEGLIRQGSFKGLREDKPASSIVREQPMAKAKTAKAKSKTSPKSGSKAKPETAASKPASSRASKGGDAIEVEGVRVTNPGRVLYPEQGITKRDLIDHYRRFAKLILPHVANRPLSLVRCPRGRERDCFFQKHASAGFPDEFRSVRISEKSGTDDYLYIDNLPGLVAAVQMGVLELHVWGSHADQVERPDRMVFDLDPGDGVDFTEVKRAAKDLRDRLSKLGLPSFPMLTGGKGVHVVIPLKPGHSWEQHRAFAESFARVLAEDEPDRYTATMSKARRSGKIFVDYLRNQRGATAIAPYSPRARPGAPFALPVTWSGLATAKSASNARIGTKAAAEPWTGYDKKPPSLPDARSLS